VAVSLLEMISDVLLYVEEQFYGVGTIKYYFFIVNLIPHGISLSTVELLKCREKEICDYVMYSLWFLMFDTVNFVVHV
jgi:hypothetical protein